MKIGSIIYLADSTRLDTSFETETLASHVNSPTHHHNFLLSQFLRYFKYTPDHCILFTPSINAILNSFSEADFAADLDRQSTTLVIYVSFSASIKWTSSKQYPHVRLNPSRKAKYSKTHYVSCGYWRKPFQLSPNCFPRLWSLYTIQQRFLRLSRSPLEKGLSTLTSDTINHLLRINTEKWHSPLPYNTKCEYPIHNISKTGQTCLPNHLSRTNSASKIQFASLGLPSRTEHRSEISDKTPTRPHCRFQDHTSPQLNPTHSGTNTIA